MELDPGAPDNAQMASIEITGLSADSRKIEPGFLFVALPGAGPQAKLDGRDFIADALTRGAVAILAAPGVNIGAAIDTKIPLLTDPNPRARLAHMAAKFYDLQPKWTTAVTGTNGKSSVVDMARQIWLVLGYKAASLGTLGTETSNRPAAREDVASGRPPALTTADPVTLHKTLADLARGGTTHVALEASSHGLDQSRLDAVAVKAAAFTNLGRDHLDYHGTSENYFAAKARLFEIILPTCGTAVLNADIPEFRELTRICRARGHRIVTYGRNGQDMRLVRTTPFADGQEIEIEIDGNRHTFRLPLIGDFQAHNLLAALGLVLANGADRAGSLSAVARIHGVPGRMELAARHSNGAGVFVDYAHTHDALETALKSIRPHCTGRLVVVFGAGGDRDRGKRPLMGQAAAQWADLTIITDDNPRSEDPASIRAEIRAACPQAREIGDRAKAIRHAVKALSPGDILVIAGKGHETGQIVGDRVIPFDDRLVARAAIAEFAPPKQGAP